MMDPEVVSRLEREANELESALADFEHEARRVCDQLERRGGSAFFLEGRLEQLKRNITATRRDLKRVRRELANNFRDDDQGATP